MADVRRLLKTAPVDAIVLTNHQLGSMTACLQTWLSAIAGTKTQLVVMADGDQNKPPNCMTKFWDKPLLHLLRSNAARFAGVFFWNQVAASRFQRAVPGVPTHTAVYEGQMYATRRAATGAGRGVLIHGARYLFNSFPVEYQHKQVLCAAARSLVSSHGATFYAKMADRHTTVGKSWCPSVIKESDGQLRQYKWLGDTPLIQGEIPVALVLSPCPSNAEPGLGQSKSITFLKMGLKVVAEESDPYAVWIPRMNAGMIVPCSACQRHPMGCSNCTRF